MMRKAPEHHGRYALQLLTQQAVIDSYNWLLTHPIPMQMLMYHYRPEIQNVSHSDMRFPATLTAMQTLSFQQTEPGLFDGPEVVGSVSREKPSARGAARRTRYPARQGVRQIVLHPSPNGTARFSPVVEPRSIPQPRPWPRHRPRHRPRHQQAVTGQAAAPAPAPAAADSAASPPAATTSVSCVTHSVGQISRIFQGILTPF
jgi:hypothetical protein